MTVAPDSWYWLSCCYLFIAVANTKQKQLEGFRGVLVAPLWQECVARAFQILVNQDKKQYNLQRSTANG